ncbi:BnaC01g30260D [Brassica napus]|uniref:BnaC01g30260D protein n=1 Tax=Brassica napus TaxID=3708 RepID=A0A078IAK6_BRANA|nr:BnaC01g30260D [Brassica napus]
MLRTINSVFRLFSSSLPLFVDVNCIDRFCFAEHVWPSLDPITASSTGYSILTRDYSKIHKIADKAVLSSSGFQDDVKALQKVCQHQHNKQMSCPAMAQLLSNTLYFKRFFHYYAFNFLGGLDEEGKGCVFTYDTVGSYEKVGYSAQGSGSTLIMPFLDNQLKSPSPFLLPAQICLMLSHLFPSLDLIMSNGIYKSLVHRVVTNMEKERISVAMFCVPGGDQEIQPVEALVTETRPRLYKTVKKYVEFYFEYYQQGRRPIEATLI